MLEEGELDLGLTGTVSYTHLDVAVNGQSLGLGGYLDIGLLDTMKDLFVNFVGAVIFSAVGYIYIRNRGKSSIAARFIPRLKKPEADFLEIARERVQEEELEERLSGEERKKKERQREMCIRDSLHVYQRAY